MANLQTTHLKPSLVALLLLILPFGLGALWPETWWATHYTHFLPIGGQGLVYVAVLLLASSPWWLKSKAKPATTPSLKAQADHALIIGITVLAGLLMHAFPIVNDLYGNAVNFLGKLHTPVTELPADFSERLFSFELKPGNGRHGIQLFVQWLAYVGETDYYTAFRWLGVGSGMCFVFVWLQGVRYFIRTTLWRWIISTIGITAPFIQIYFGHIETYGPVFVVLLSWLFLLLYHLKTGKAGALWLLLPLTLLAMRLHTLLYLLWPILGLAMLRHYGGKSAVMLKLMTLKGMLLGVYLPICLAGLYLYFGVFGDHVDQRFIDDSIEDIDRLFLPLYSPDAPLDRYNLLSLNHLTDYLQVILTWAPAGLFLLLSMRFGHRKAINWNHAMIVFPFLALLLFATVLFMINPLFSLPMDWDLMALSAPAFLVLLVGAASQAQDFSLPRKVWSPILALCILGLPGIYVNATVEPHSYRLEMVGRHVYKTYYQHSESILLFSMQMIPNDADRYEQRQETLLTDLAPHAQKDHDPVYSTLALDAALFQRDARQNLAAARKHMELALAFDIENYDYALQLLEICFRQGDFAAAFEHARLLEAVSYPNRQQSLRIVIHCALEAEEYDSALHYSRDYVNTYGDDQMIQTVRDRLEAGNDVASLKFLFNRGR